MWASSRPVSSVIGTYWNPCIVRSCILSSLRSGFEFKSQSWLKFNWLWLPGIKLIICHQEKDQTLTKQQKQSLRFIKYFSFHKIISSLIEAPDKKMSQTDSLPELTMSKHWFRKTSDVAVKHSWLSCLKTASPGKQR